MTVDKERTVLAEPHPISKPIALCSSLIALSLLQSGATAIGGGLLASTILGYGLVMTILSKPNSDESTEES